MQHHYPWTFIGDRVHSPINSRVLYLSSRIVWWGQYHTNLKVRAHSLILQRLCKLDLPSYRLQSVSRLLDSSYLGSNQSRGCESNTRPKVCRVDFVGLGLWRQEYQSLGRCGGYLATVGLRFGCWLWLEIEWSDIRHWEFCPGSIGGVHTRQPDDLYQNRVGCTRLINW